MRLPAKKVDVKTLIEGQYVQQEGWEPNYVVTAIGVISRARIIGVVLEVYLNEDSTQGTMVIDDNGTTIRVRAFENVDAISSLKAGELVEIFGKVKKYNEEIYLIPDIILKISDKRWLKLRKLEIDAEKKRQEVMKKEIDKISEKFNGEELIQILRERFNLSKEEIKEMMKEEEIEVKKEEAEKNEKENEKEKEILLKLISTLDKGEGVSYEDFMQKSGKTEEEFDRILGLLVDDGDVFEPRPGRYKKL